MSPADLQIEQVAETREFRLYRRGSCVAMVHGASIGSSGFMTEQGLAYLVWREGVAFLVAKGGEIVATPEQVKEIQKFSEDLKRALEPPMKP